MRDGKGETERSHALQEPSLDHRGVAWLDQRLEGAPSAGAAEDQVATADRDHVEPAPQAGERVAERRERRVRARVVEQDEATAGPLAATVKAMARLGVHEIELQRRAEQR